MVNLTKLPSYFKLLIKLIRSSQNISKTSLTILKKFFSFKGGEWEIKKFINNYLKWKIKIQGEEFMFSRGKIKLIQPSGGIFGENFDKMYKVTDYKEKTVLDVGGFLGETAALFKHWGAKKVIIYEPLKERIRYIKKM